MYIPTHFVAPEPHVLEAMRASDFVTLVGLDDDGAPCVTHCPVVVEDDGRRIVGHVARANPHWEQLGRHPRVLAIFPGPHAYVSPSWYASRLSVPTWNYIAVHATGVVTLMQDAEEKDAMLARLIERHEPAHLAQWRAQPPAWRNNMLGGIVGFSIAVERLEAKFKLSQNKSAQDRQSVHDAHAAGGDDMRALAAWMRRLGMAQEKAATDAADASVVSG